MKLQHLSVIFIIIVLPIILLLSYYISLQIDTISMKNSYATKHLEATKEAVEAFEINTVEWNEAYSETADSKRRDIMASINTFTTAFANSLGIGGATKETIMPFVPAIAFTLYDGYYIYSPAETKDVIKDENGVAVFDENGEIEYGDGTTYSHILKPFSTYSARYVSGSNIDIIINYTLDNYISIYGNVGERYHKKSGYLIDINRVNMPKNTINGIKLDGDISIEAEILREKIAWKRTKDEKTIVDEYYYVYEAENNTKVYFDGTTPFQINSNGIRTDLAKLSNVKYKKLSIYTDKYTCIEIYQALNNSKDGNIIAGKWYIAKNSTVEAKNYGQGSELIGDFSAVNYYTESYAFSEWVYDKLGNITVDNMKERTEEIAVTGTIFDKIENEDSVFNMHRREVIKQVLISNLNQAITSYSRNSEGEYQLPMLSETDWDQILRNVSIITFVQDIPIGLNNYNNYAIATSTSNKEFVNINEIYLHTTSNTDGYYHMPYCEKLQAEKVIGYRNLDYVIKSYETENKETKYYYKHENIANQACYYCLIQRSLFSGEGLDDNTKNSHENAYKRALARERYVTHEFR